MEVPGVSVKEKLIGLGFESRLFTPFPVGKTSAGAGLRSHNGLQDCHPGIEEVRN